jgi:L-amino acid N-acyltransferase YncA
MSDIDIRAATPGDVAAIARIYADAVRHGTATFEIEPPTRPKWRGAWGRFLRATIPIS